MTTPTIHMAQKHILHNSQFIIIMKKLFLYLFLLCAVASSGAAAALPISVIADEGAWCWFADPRALHYENASATINATYIGYIDVHGNVKATQYDWLKHRKTDVLIRSYFQPDDHNNPTFVVLPDERVMVFYTRHTDEAKIWYRISSKAGDITSLGEEKYLTTANNTTYPSPFILSDDPQHIYLCWRGINWHPTIARITMPDAHDNCQFDFGPKQIVQSTGARPYAKYQSNGKDKIFLAYTTGHPDNEMPDWLYFNVIDINNGNGPILRDLNGTELKRVANGVFNVSKTSSYASSYPTTIVDNTSGVRNWLWQIVLDSEGKPVIAYPHIDDAKTNHEYWYARWTGSEWRRTKVADGGHGFHQNWNQTERCYSGGMSLDSDNVGDLYLSIPTTGGSYNKNGVYEIWKYTINADGEVMGSEQLTQNSTKNNVRPFVIPGSKNSPMRVAWMNGDYYYWMVNKNYPKGYPTEMHAGYDWTETLTQEQIPDALPNCFCFSKNETLTMAFAMNENKYEGALFTIGHGIDATRKFVYSLDADQYPVVTIDGIQYKSQNRLLTSDDWAIQSSGTNGDNHPTKVGTWILSMTYDGQTLTTYRNGFVDQVIELGDWNFGTVNWVTYENTGTQYNHTLLTHNTFYGVASPVTVQDITKRMQSKLEAEKEKNALMMLSVSTDVHTDIVLPVLSLGLPVTWQSSNAAVLSADGIVTFPAAATSVTLTATCGSQHRDFNVTVHPRDLTTNLRYSKDNIDLTGNTATGFNTNTAVTAPEGLLTDLRSYTVLVTAKMTATTKQPRIYDFGSGSGNSLFLRADALSAGIKYNGGTTTMVTSQTKLQVGTQYKLAVTFDAASRVTRVYINGVEDISGTANQVEPYQLALIASDTRNYIGRTQWWDGSYKADNQDFCGTIDGFRLYDVCLTRQEICTLQGLPYEQNDLPSALTNGDFEGSYSEQQGSGVSSDRAIYVPQGWTVDRASGNENDLTALRSGDKYFDQFFAALAHPDNHGAQTYWIRQNWGTPTLTLSQELRLPAGKYVLSCDMWKSGLGGDAIVSVLTEGGGSVSSPTLDNKEEWQPVTLSFTSDGVASTTITLTAKHTSSGSAKIIGFDNVTIKVDKPVGVTSLNPHPSTLNPVYDLSGRRLSSEAAASRKGVFITAGRKIVK